jgi:hypothetical protein
MLAGSAQFSRHAWLTRAQGLVDISLQPALVAAVAARAPAKGKRKSKSKTVSDAESTAEGSSMAATIETVKEEYAIASTTAGQICVFGALRSLDLADARLDLTRLVCAPFANGLLSLG